MDELKIKIAIIDDDVDKCTIIGIKAILQEKMPNMTDICYTCNSPKDFIEYCNKANPNFDILLVDMHFGRNADEGLKVLKYVKDTNKTYKPIIITGHSFKKELIEDAKKLGVKCYLPKNLMIDLLADVIKTVYAGLEMDGNLINYWLSYRSLTPTEREVFEYFAIGKTPAEIADILIPKIKKEKKDKDRSDLMELNTIGRYLTEIRKKMNLQTDALATVVAIKLKIPKVLDELGIQKKG